MQVGARSAVGLASIALAVAWLVFPGLAPAQDAAGGEAAEPSEDYVQRFQEGQRLMGRGKPASDDESERIFRSLLFERPRQAEVHHALGILLMHRGRRKECIGYLLDAARYAPVEPVIQRDAGSELLYQARAPEAVAYFSRARKEAPEDIETWIGWGRSLLLTGDVERAGEAFRAALRLDEGSIDARVGLGWTLVEKDPAEARRQVGAPVPPHFSDVALVDGLALERQGKFDEAAARLLVSVEYAPTDGVGAAVLAAATEAFVRHRHLEGAAAASSKWLDATLRWDSPDRFRAGFVLAMARLALGRTASGLAAIGSVATDEKAPPELRARAYLVWADRLAAAGDADAARVQLAAAAKLTGEGAQGAEFEASAAKAILDGKEVPPTEGRANDLAWFRAIAARLAGDAEAAARHEARSAEASDPPGEFPGLLLARPKATGSDE